MPSKCYIVDYDNKINHYKKLLNKMTNSYLYDGNNIQLNKNSVYLNQLSEQQELHKYLFEIEQYLDEMLHMPGMSDEELYNLRKDQKEIVNMMDEISSKINVLEKDIGNNCNKSTEKKFVENRNVSSEIPNDTSPNITININSGEKKTTFYQHRKMDPQKIKI